MKQVKMVCPNLECGNHVEGISDEPKWYKKFGFYYSKRLKKKIQRFQCKKCGKTFSTQTFSVDYWVKITVDYKSVEDLNQKCDTIREMGKRMNRSDCVIRNRLERLSRQFAAIDWKYEHLCVAKSFMSTLEGLYRVGSDAERYIVNNLGTRYRAAEQQRMLKSRFFISHMDLEGPILFIWLQKYKPESAFIPKFIAE